VNVHARHFSLSAAAPTRAGLGFETISIVIAERHPQVREALRVGLSHEPDFIVIGEASDRDEALRLASTLHPQVMLLDPALSQNSGLEVLSTLKGRSHRTRIIVMAHTEASVDVVSAFQHGARGVVRTDTPTELLFKSIRKVHRGELWISRETVAELVETLVAGTPPRTVHAARRADVNLTSREREILALLAEGETNKAIAARLSITTDTVKHHLTNIFSKTGTSSRLELALITVKNPLLSPAL
jgi:DNA-binding NarL/FixJ family response regulator